MFFEFDPTLHKSKYIMKYLNNRNQHNECWSNFGQ
jgi:hypothetical protein